MIRKVVTSRILRSGWQIWRKSLFLVISIFALVSLTVCCDYLEGHGTFYPNDEWKAEISLSFTPQQLMLCGGEQALGYVEGCEQWSDNYTQASDTVQDCTLIIGNDGDNLRPLEEPHVLPVHQEEHVPEQIFEEGDSLEELRDKIQQNGYNFTVDHNWVYDMSPEEKEKFFSRHDSGFFEGIDASEDIGPLASQLGRKQLPSQFDWRNYTGHSYIGDIKNQGSCGSCYAFGACAAAEGTYNWAMGLYDANCTDLSESFIMWCLGSLPQYYSHFYGCDGADYSYSELTALTVEGICNEADFPYQTSSGCGDHWDDPRITFDSWHRVPCGDIEAIKTAIMTYGPVDAAVYVGSAFQAYSSGIYEDSNTACDSSPCFYTPTNHAIALVGWNDNGNPETDGYWILRNSWGSDDWGENGYMRIKYHSAVVACEACYMVYTPDSAPNITVSPTSFEVWLPPNTTQDETLTIGNVGEGSLNYSISDRETTGEGSAVRGVEDEVLEPASMVLEVPLEGSPMRAEDTGELENGWQDIMTEDFEGSFPPSGWTIIQYSGNGTWEQEAYGVDTYEPPGTGSYYAEADSDEHASYIFDTGLFTPSIDCSECANVSLAFARNFQDFAGYGYAEVSTYSGGTDYPDDFEENLWNQTVDDPLGGVDTTLYFDPSGYADPTNVYIEFHYTTEGDVYCWKFAIDDVVLSKMEAAEDCLWLDENPTSGTVEPGSSDNITVTINTTGLGSNYTAEIVIANNDPDENPTIVPVTLHVTTMPCNLTISSTAGGNVTTPGEDTFTYNASEVVALVATPDLGYHFVNWTGEVGTIADDTAANTTITMNDNYTITANFAEVSGATLEGHVSFTGRGSNNTKWAEPFNVTLFEPGNLSNVLWTGNATTNNTGVFTISGLTAGSYDIGIKNWTCLSELNTSVTLTAGMTTVVDFGTTREGDANNDDYINILDASSLASSYGSSEGGPDWNAHCDFNRDGNINILDASTLTNNYGQHGDLT